MYIYILWMPSTIKRQRMTLIGWSTTTSSVIGWWIWGMAVIGCLSIRCHMTGPCFVGLCEWWTEVIGGICSPPTQLNPEFSLSFSLRVPFSMIAPQTSPCTNFLKLPQIDFYRLDFRHHSYHWTKLDQSRQSLNSKPQWQFTSILIHIVT